MSDSNTTRYVWLAVADIEAVADWSLAAPEQGGPLDRPFSIDADGRPYIPPSSIAGSIRDHLSTTGGHDACFKWMGGRAAVPSDQTSAAASKGTPTDVLGPAGHRGVGENDAKRLVPSLLRVVGTRFVDTPATAISRQTAIDGRTAAAKQGSLRSSVVVLDGASVRVYLRADVERHDEALDLEEALSTWVPVIGGGRTAGRGTATLASLRSGIIDLESREGRLSWLEGSGPSLFEATATRSVELKSGVTNQAVTSATFVLKDPLVLGGGKPDGARNKRGLLSKRPGSYVLPGTAIKGLFRHRFEFILVSAGVETEQARMVADYWFGKTGRRGRLRFADAQIVGSNGTGEPRIAWRPHVSIDRLTGGAANERLFQQEVVVSGSLTIEVADTRPTGAGVEADASDVSVVINWVVHDIADGYVGVGAMTGRGYGTLRLADPSKAPPRVPISPEVIARLVHQVVSAAESSEERDDKPATVSVASDSELTGTGRNHR